MKQFGKFVVFNLIYNYNQDAVSKSNYFDLLKMYADELYIEKSKSTYERRK